MNDRDSLRTLLAKRAHEAEEALSRGDVGPRMEMWSHNDPVTLFGAVGVSKSGWAELEPTFRKVASRLAGGHDVTYEVIAFDVSGDAAWMASIARFTLSMDGGPLTRMAIRATIAYRREAGEWKVVHEHTDFQPPDHAVSGRLSP